MGTTNNHAVEGDLPPAADEPQEKSLSMDFNLQSFHDDFSTWFKHAPYFNLSPDDANDSLTTKETNPWRTRFYGAWRTNVTAGLFAILFVFFVNLGVFIWLCLTTTGIRNGSTVAYEGSCANIRRIST